MIIGVGIDVVGIDRFERTLERTPALRERLFTPSERDLPIISLAARFAAKEALAKALGAPVGLSWHDVWVVRPHASQPRLEITGSVQARAEELGIDQLHLSISHDGGIATAFVVAEGDAADPEVRR